MTRKPHPTDLTDAQWRRIARLVPAPKPGGRPARYARREVVNAVLYQARSGRVRRALPHDLPPYRVVFHDFRAWRRGGTWDRIHAAFRAEVRQAVGKRPKTSAAAAGGRTVKGTEPSAPNGYDGGKKGGRPRAVRGR